MTGAVLNKHKACSYHVEINMLHCFLLILSFCQHWFCEGPHNHRHRDNRSHSNLVQECKLFLQNGMTVELLKQEDLLNIFVRQGSVGQLF